MGRYVGFYATILFMLRWLHSSEATTITDVRLVDGGSPSAGRVEIFVDGDSWYTVCGTSWDMNDVLVTCKQLGFTGAQLEVTRSEFGSGTFPVYSDSFFCKGNEDTLPDCSMRGTQCSGGDNIAGVVCHGLSYLGCYGDNPLNRPFSGAAFHDSTNMTISACLSFCRDRGYAFAGLELGSECYCGIESADYTEYGAYGDEECRHTCTGNNLETCGGIAKMAVHLTAVVLPSTAPPTTAEPRTPNRLDETTIGTTSSSSYPATSPEQTSTDPESRHSSPEDEMRLIVYVLGVLLFVCLIIIVGCIVWNCKLKSRIRTSYQIAHDDHHSPPLPPQNAPSATQMPYMALSQRRNDENGYQGLSVLERDGQKRAGLAAARAGRLLSDPVYQEPSLYMEPDNVCAVKFSSKPGESHTDDFLGGGNEYETLGK